MHIDFSQVEDVEDFTTIPEGTYPCRVAEVREGLTRDGSPRWSFRLEVSAGDYAGRTGGWDSVSFSERGMRRAKYVLEQLGFDVDAALELAPEDLCGRFSLVQFQTEEREDQLTGTRQIRMRVPFLGYEPLESPDWMPDGSRTSDESRVAEGHRFAEGGGLAEGGVNHGAS